MRSIVLSFVFVALASSLVACGGGVSEDAATGDQRLQTRKDGSATGNGMTCSWDGTALLDQMKATNPDAPKATYQLGEDFASPDGCNVCACTARGIACTEKACAPATECPAIARVCPDGSAATTGPRCEQICPAASCEAISGAVGKQLLDVVTRHKACERDDDCTIVAISADCVDACSRAMNKAGAMELGAAKQSANDTGCADYAKQGCTLIRPPCDAPDPPRCVDRVCR